MSLRAAFAAILAICSVHAVASAPEPVVRATLADAAKRTGVTSKKLEVVGNEAVTWPDSSLGCPQPDMGYMQALVPGFRIQVRAGSHLLDYHAGANGRWVLCPAGRSMEPLPDTGK